ncbi:hypothetical protein [Natrinema thermotolerans]
MNTIEKELEILEYYQEEVANDNYKNTKEDLFDNLLDDEDAIEAAEEQYENRKEESKHKKKVRTTLMAAFLRNGPIERVTNWEFKRLFPLRTLNVDSADVLIGNQTDGSVLLIIILPLRQRPETGIDDAVEMLEGVRDNNSALRDDIGLDFRNDRIQTAIAIEPARANDTAVAIEDYEQSTADPEDFYVWRITGTEGAKIDVYTDFPSSSGQNRCHDGDLGQVLDPGREIMDSPHVLPDFFYDTHHSLLLEHAVIKMSSNHLDTDVPNTHFSVKEMRNYFDDTLYGSDSTHKASTLTERVIKLWDYLNLITKVQGSNDKIEDGSTAYRFKSRKQNPQNIHDDISDNYDETCIEFLVESRAMEQTIEEFEEDKGVQADLAAFGS